MTTQTIKRSILVATASACIAGLVAMPTAVANEVVFTIGTARTSWTVTGMVGESPLWLIYIQESLAGSGISSDDFYEDPTTENLYNIDSVDLNFNAIIVGNEFTDADPSSSGTATVGRAFGTIGAWEAAISLYHDPGDRAKAEVYNDALIQESSVNITDTTLGTSGQLIITVPETERHAGVAGTGARWQQTSSGPGLRLNIWTAYTPQLQIIEGLEIVGIAGPSMYPVLVSRSAGPGQTIIRNMIVRDYDPSAQSATAGLRSDAAGVDFINCLVYSIKQGAPGYAVGVWLEANAGNVRILNCTFDSCYDYAIRSVHSSGLVAPLVQNCAVFRTTANVNSAFLSNNGWHANSGYNCTDATSGVPGAATSLTGQSASAQFLSLTPGSEDYHLKSTATSVDAGTDLSLLFSEDFEAQPRSGWDIGADELGRVYYVDAVTGNDANDGLSPSRAWQTATEVSDRSPNFGAGDHVLFKRGQEFQGQIKPTRPNPDTNPPTATHRLTFASYGTGDLPRVGFDERYNDGDSWTLDSNNVYYTSRTQTPTYVSYLAAGDTRWLQKKEERTFLDDGAGWHHEVDSNNRENSRLYVRLYDNSDPDLTTVYLNTGPAPTLQDPTEATLHHSVHIRDIAYGTVRELHAIAGRRGIFAYNSPNVIIEDCVSTGHVVGLTCSGGSDNALVRYNRSQWTIGPCMSFGGSSGRYHDNTLSDCNEDQVFNPNTGATVGADPEGIAINNAGGKDVEIDHNTIMRTRDAIPTFLNPDAVGGDIHIHHNWIEDIVSEGIVISSRFNWDTVVDGTEALADYAGDLVIHHNVIWKTGQAAIRVEGPQCHTSSGALRIDHNTIAQTAMSSGLQGALQVNQPNALVRNNVTYITNGRTVLLDGPGLEATYWNNQLYSTVDASFVATSHNSGTAGETSCRVEEDCTKVEDPCADDPTCNHSTDPDDHIFTLYQQGKFQGFTTTIGTTVHDYIEITGGSGITPGWYEVEEKVDNDTLICWGDPGADATDVAWELWKITSVTDSTSTLPGTVSGDLDDPNLADPENGDFNLQSALPGLDLGYDVDFNGNPIPPGGAHRGAFQYVAP